MKKVSIILLLVAIMVLSMTGCAFLPNEVMEEAPAEIIGSGTLRFKSKGTYYTSNVGTDSVVYNFGYPNDDIVVYQMPGTFFLVGENCDERNISYAANVFIKNGEFVALSDKYLLFATAESKGMIAVPIENGTTGLVLECSFEDLSEEEKDAFVYPVERNVFNS